MKYSKHVTIIACLVISITLFTSCERISGIFNSSATIEDTEEVDNSSLESTKVSNDSTSIAKENSLAQVRKDSLARVEAAQLTKEIENKLSSQSDSINDLNLKISDLEKKSESMMDKSTAYAFMVVEIILFLLIMWFLYGKLNDRLKKMKSRLHYLENTEDGAPETKVNHMIQSAMNNLVIQINKVNHEQNDIINKIDQRLSKLEGQNDAYYQHAQTQFQDPDAPNEEEEPKKADTFYMPRTRTDSQFDDNKKKIVKDETTYFKFTIKKGGKAEFTFEPLESNIIGAYDDRENSLVTVCEIYSKSATPTKYKNIEPGEAELRGNIWYVTSKLKLEYV